MLYIAHLNQWYGVYRTSSIVFNLLEFKYFFCVSNNRRYLICIYIYVYLSFQSLGSSILTGTRFFFLSFFLLLSFLSFFFPVLFLIDFQYSCVSIRFGSGTFYLVIYIYLLNIFQLSIKSPFLSLSSILVASNIWFNIFGGMFVLLLLFVCVRYYVYHISIFLWWWNSSTF